MAEEKVLAKPVHIDGEVIQAGTTLTEEQAKKITNPKAFIAEPTLDDKVRAAQEEYEKLLQQAETQADAGAKRTAEAATVKDARPEQGAALARKSTPAKATGESRG